MTRIAQESTPRKRQARKRADGEGTISEHATSGMWRGRLMVGRKPNGKPEIREVYAKTQAECRRKLDALKSQASGGLLPEHAKSDSLAVYLDRWLETKQGNVKPRTHERYTSVLKHVKTSIGKKALTGVKPEDLAKLYAAKLESGLSPRTVHHIHTVTHTALEQAVKWAYVPRNIADVVTPPSVPAKEIRPLSGDEVAHLLATAERHQDRLRALWAVATYTGMRQGELLGLTWDDVDLDAGELQIRRILVKVKNYTGVYGEPKTKRSRRPVPLTDDAILALRAHRIRQLEEKLHLGADYTDTGLVFCTHMGTPLDRTVVQAQFKRALSRADLSSTIRFHDLRHTAATLMLAGGVDIPTAAAILGHSQNSTTLNVYAHAMPSRLKGATNAIQAAIRGVSAG